MGARVNPSTTNGGKVATMDAKDPESSNVKKGFLGIPIMIYLLVIGITTGSVIFGMIAYATFNMSAQYEDAAYDMSYIVINAVANSLRYGVLNFGDVLNPAMELDGQTTLVKQDWYNFIDTMGETTPNCRVYVLESATARIMYTSDNTSHFALDENNQSLPLTFFPHLDEIYNDMNENIPGGFANMSYMGIGAPDGKGYVFSRINSGFLGRGAVFGVAARMTSWSTVIIFPGVDVAGSLPEDIESVIIASVVAFVVGTVVIVFISFAITQPFASVEKDMAIMQTLQTDMMKQTPESKIVHEMNTIQSGYNDVVGVVKSFARFVPMKIVEGLAGKQAKLDMRKREVTCFFSDIEGFTTIAEHTPPDTIIKWLNEYFTHMSSIIENHEGTVIEYIGDCIMACWNAPEVLKKNHTKLALEATWAQIQGTKVVNESFKKKEGYAQIKARIGIHRGTVLEGVFGSNQRLKYGLAGDTVNLCSRLEYLNKLYGTYIIVSEDVYAHTKEDWVYRLLDQVIVKGRTQPTKIYELISSSKDVTDKEKAKVRDYHSAMDKYFAKNFTAALSDFKAFALNHGERKCVMSMIHRCNEYIEVPPSTDWNGVYTLKIKG